MAYDLFASGVTDLARYTQLLDLRRVTRDPLSGIVDGTNYIFNTTYSPCLSSGSTAVSVNYVNQTGYTFIFDTGEIQLASPPASQPFANYTSTSLTSETIKRMLFLGLDEMETRWARGFRLSSSLSSYVPATESDVSAYIVDPNLLVDPVAGTASFSLARAEIAFYMKSVQYAYFSHAQFQTAMDGISYKEAGGMSVSTVSRSPAIDKLLARLDKEMGKQLISIQAAWLQGGGFAAFIRNEHSKDYSSNFEWRASQTDSPAL
jgi:hypothetical protein